MFRPRYVSLQARPRRGALPARNRERDHTGARSFRSLVRAPKVSSSFSERRHLMDEPEILTGQLNRAETRDPTAAAGTKPVSAPNLNTILSIPVTVQVVLGSTSLPVAN